MIFEIHGGPFAMYQGRFNLTYQIYAANGFVVLYTNPRGSTGYEAFSQAISRLSSVDTSTLWRVSTRHLRRLCRRKAPVCRWLQRRWRAFQLDDRPYRSFPRRLSVVRSSTG